MEEIEENLKFEVHYKVGEYKDTIIITGKNLEEVKENCFAELEKRNALYEYSINLKA